MQTASCRELCALQSDLADQWIRSGVPHRTVPITPLVLKPVAHAEQEVPVVLGRVVLVKESAGHLVMVLGEGVVLL